MKPSLALSIAGFLQLASAAAILHPRHAQNVPGVVAAPMWRRGRTRSVENDIARRDHLTKRQTVPVSLENAEGKLLYFAQVSIGTPPQSLLLQIDTGSSDTWVEVPESLLCRARSQPCAISGTYDNSSSSTYHYVNSLFDIQYGDGTAAIGDYATETFHIGAAKVTNMQFGVGIDTTSTEGIMGLGFDLHEAILPFDGGSPYPNLVDQMVSEDLIQSRIFSLYLDDIDDSTGSILFGGVDTNKFSGTLATFPINTDSSGVATQFVITLTGMSLTTPNDGTVGIGASSVYPFSVLLDSGSSYMSLPQNIVSSLASIFDATYSSDLGEYVLSSCDQQYASGTLNLFFSGVEIRVPYGEFIVNPVATDGSLLSFSDGSLLCVLGVIPGPSNEIAVLGDTFLRSAYVVYDLDNKQISLAQTKFNVTSSNIQAIPSGKNNIPSASAVQNPTTLVLGSDLLSSNISIGLNPTGTSVGGAIPSGSSSRSSSAASGYGFYGSKTGMWFGLTTCMCFIIGGFLAL